MVVPALKVIRLVRYRVYQDPFWKKIVRLQFTLGRPMNCRLAFPVTPYVPWSGLWKMRYKQARSKPKWFIRWFQRHCFLGIDGICMHAPSGRPSPTPAARIVVSCHGTRFSITCTTRLILRPWPGRWKSVLHTWCIFLNNRQRRPPRPITCLWRWTRPRSCSVILRWVSSRFQTNWGTLRCIISPACLNPKSDYLPVIFAGSSS